MSVVTMKRSKKLRRVSWAPDRNLCQVRVFRSDCCPEESCEVQDYLQPQDPNMWCSNDLDSNLIPPGFGTGGMVPLWKGKPLSIPMIKWKSPSRFILCGEWQVVAGEESQEAGTQKLRELRVLEAFYPHVSAIPPSPCDAQNMDEIPFDDRRTPVVPLTPIEDEEPPYSSADSATAAKTDVHTDLATPSLQSGLVTPTIPATLQPPGFIPSHSTASTTQQHMPILNPLPPEIPVKPIPGADASSSASSVALAALLKGKKPDSLIDTDLLIKILSDQQMVQKLLKETVSPPQTQNATKPVHQTGIPPGHLPSPGIGLSFSAGLANGKSVTDPNRIQSELLKMPQTLQNNISTSWTKPPSACGSETTRSFSTMKPDAAFSSAIKVQPTPNIMHSHHEIGVVNSVTAPRPIKDINYYKSLIKLHGGENQDTQEKPLVQYGQHGHFQETKKDIGLMMHNQKSKNMDVKFQKPCLYFKSSKGCRNGLNCPYKHDLTSQLQVDVISEVHQGAKRMKFS